MKVTVGGSLSQVGRSENSAAGDPPLIGLPGGVPSTHDCDIPSGPGPWGVLVLLVSSGQLKR